MLFVATLVSSALLICSFNYANINVAPSLTDYEDVTIAKNGSYKYIATSFAFTKFTRIERLITYGYITTTFTIINHHNIIFG